LKLLKLAYYILYKQKLMQIIKDVFFTSLSLMLVIFLWKNLKKVDYMD